jgi:hypothetical protein
MSHAPSSNTGRDAHNRDPLAASCGQVNAVEFDHRGVAQNASGGFSGGQTSDHSGINTPNVSGNVNETERSKSPTRVDDFPPPNTGLPAPLPNLSTQPTSHTSSSRVLIKKDFKQGFKHNFVLEHAEGETKRYIGDLSSTSASSPASQTVVMGNFQLSKDEILSYNAILAKFRVSLNVPSQESIDISPMGNTGHSVLSSQEM